MDECILLVLVQQVILDKRPLNNLFCYTIFFRVFMQNEEETDSKKERADKQNMNTV